MGINNEYNPKVKKERSHHNVACMYTRPIWVGCIFLDLNLQLQHDHNIHDHHKTPFRTI